MVSSGITIIFAIHFLSGIQAENETTVITDQTSSENATTITTSAIPTTSRPPTLPPCGYCPMTRIGGKALFNNKPIQSVNISNYAMCQQVMQCMTVITIPERHYILLGFENKFMVPGDSLSIFDGDLSLDVISDSKKLLAVYGTDETGGATVESNGNKITILFDFRYHKNRYPQSWYIARYNAMKIDCSCSSSPPALQQGSIQFQSPNYPHYYCPNSHCEYFVNISHQEATAYCGQKPLEGLILTFSPFDLNENDYVAILAMDKIGGDQLIAGYFGKMSATPIQIKGLNLKVIFDGTNGGSHIGFQANVQIDCGDPPLIDDPMAKDAFHLTMGTLTAISLCSLAILIVFIVALVAVRENRRWRRARESQMEFRDFNELRSSDPMDTPISIIGPLPSYNDALHCLKWEPSSVYLAATMSNSNSRQTSVESGTSLSPENLQPPPYTPESNLITVEINSSSDQIQNDQMLRTSQSDGNVNHGFNNDEETLRMNKLQ